MLANKTITTLYNPGEKDREVLKAEFVIRLKEFNNIFNDIKTSKMEKPEQHYLLIGQRGSGKSTLIQRLRYAIEDDTELSQWLIPIAFTEEQYNITELGNLWERIAENLEDYHHMPGIVAELEKQLDKREAEKKQLDVLLSYLRKNNKKIVVFIDNIGDMLKKFEEIEVKRLRSVLQTVSEIRIVAATPVVLDEVTDYQKALFEFFKNVRLRGLDKDEMETLLRQLGKTHDSSRQIENIIEDTPERIEILRRLTGGIARTVVMMYNVFVENEEGNPIGDLQLILDEATPLYKHKMDDLPMQQQKIVDAVAKKWVAISAGELAEKLRMESKNVSAHLRQLEKDQWIEKIETDTKNNFYQIQERFFNIWYLMRNGRRFEKTRVIWLVKFMESWLEREEIEKRMEAMTQKLVSGKLPKDDFLFWIQVFPECEGISPYLKFNFLESARRYISLAEFDMKKIEERQLELAEELNEHPETLKEHQIESMFRHLKNEHGDENAETSWIISLETIQSQEAKIFWLDWFSKRAPSDNTGFFDQCAFLLGLKAYNAYDISYWQNALNKKNLIAVVMAMQSRPMSDIFIREHLTLMFKMINPRYHHYTLYQAWLALYQLLNNEIESSCTLITKLLTFKNLQNVPFSLNFFDLSNYLILLTAKQQYQTVYHLLTGEEFTLRLVEQPIYYALMHYMKDEYPNEYLRMPPEMKETVEDVIKKIEEYKVKYA